MPFIVVCPHCRDCRFRAPRSKRGQPFRCPKCQEVFPLLPPDESLSSDQQDSPATPALTPKSSTSPSANDPNGLVPLAKVALGSSAVALFLSQLPYGRLPALMIAVLASLAAAFSLLELHKHRAFLGWLGLFLNGSLAVILIGYPATLGISGWWSDKTSLVSENLEQTEEDWIDAGDAAWQQGGVRVSVTFATVGSDPSASASSKERFLWIGLKITNVGVGGGLEFTGWPERGDAAPVMSTADGTVFPTRKFVGQSSKCVIPPARFQECMMAFEIPPPGQDLLLRVPTQPLGDNVVIRFRIPHLLVGRQ